MSGEQPGEQPGAPAPPQSRDRDAADSPETQPEAQPATGEPVEAPPPSLPPPPERYPFWDYTDVLAFAGLAIPSMLLAEVLVKIFVKWFHLHPAPKVMELLPAQFLGYLFLFSGLVALFRWKYDRPFWRSLAWTRIRVPFSLVALCGVLTALGVGVASNLIHTPETNNPMTELMQGRSALIVMAVFGVTMGPLFEELGFRGFLQPLLVRSAGVVPGILLAAIPFGLLHYQEYGNSWRHALVISMAGAAFGAMRHLTGSTRAAVLMHAAYNAFFFFVLFAGKGQP
jgi:membrane protease YdiL (CAAX protease family)